MILSVSVSLTFLLAVFGEPVLRHQVHPRSGGEKCGQAPLAGISGRSDDRIVNGTVSKRGQFPYQANLLKDVYGPGYYPSHFCGGAIYNKNTVITAAHCLYGSDATAVSKLVVRFGDFEDFKDEEGEQTRKVKSIKLHPKYDNENMYFDVALMELSEPITYTDYVQPICLPTQTVQGGEKAVVSGWGDTKGTGSEDVLNMVEVPIVSKEVCRQKEWYGHQISDDMICAGYAEGAKDSCQGDSGGPLARVVDGAYELTGVVSWGNGCAEPKKPGVYCDVSFVKSWILQNVF